MLDDLAGKRTGERIQILRERKGLSRPVLAGLVGMSASWLKGIEQGRRLPPRLPVLVKLAEALAVGDITVLAGTDMNIGSAGSVPVASFARIPHDALPAIREAVRDPMLTVSDSPVSIDALAGRVARRLDPVAHLAAAPHRRRAHPAPPAHRRPRRRQNRHRARTANSQRAAGRGVRAGPARDRVGQRSRADLDRRRPRHVRRPGRRHPPGPGRRGLDPRHGPPLRRATPVPRSPSPPTLAPSSPRAWKTARTTCAAWPAPSCCTPRPPAPGPGREGDAWRHWDHASALARQLPAGYHHPWTMFGTANIDLHAVSINADLTKSRAAQNQAEQIDPETIPSRERRGRLGVEIARSYHQRRDYTAMLHWLEYAHHTATDSVHYSPAARQMTAEAVDHGGQLIRTRARALAGSLGLPL